MRFGVLVFLVALLSGAVVSQQAGDTGWPTYGGDPGGSRFSALKEINAGNVTNLHAAWTYHTGALQPETDLNHKAAFEATPILVDGTLYLSTPFDQVIALDPETGLERWKYDPHIDRSRSYSEVTSRGVAAWEDPGSRNGAPCQLRVFVGTIDSRLLALDGRTGELCRDFGAAGQVDLTKDVDLVSSKWRDYQITSAPTVVGNVVITGSSIGDNRAVSVERGIVRAFDVHSGKLCWTWDPIPWAEQQKLRTGAGNAWSTISADPKRDLVFIPTGSASPDFYGGLRPGNDANANSVVALRASTGEFVWSFQVVHHDLWDYDVAAEPVGILFRGHEAIAVTTKIGNLFVLDRATGKPLNEVVERPVPKSDVPGERASSTQPFPTGRPWRPRDSKRTICGGRRPKRESGVKTNCVRCETMAYSRRRV